MNERIPIFAANWKMNKLLKEMPDFVNRLMGSLQEISSKLGCPFEVWIAPSSTHLTELSQLLRNTSYKLGAQNCGTAKSGAFTGEVSPVVLKEIGCHGVVVGHSERRHVFKEEDLLIQSRMKAALEEGLNVMLCVGEVLQDRKAGKTFKVVESQLGALKTLSPVGSTWEKVSIAYEPVWAIGTGENATPQQAQEVHAYIRNWVSEKVSSEVGSKVRILYGGSVRPENSTQLLGQKDIDGLLVGGASLDPVSFGNIIKNGLKSRA